MELEEFSLISIVLCSINSLLGTVCFLVIITCPLNVNANVNVFLIMNCILITFMSIFYGHLLRMYLLVPIFGGAYLGLLKFLPGDLLNFCTVVSFVIVLFNIIIIELEGRRHYQRICHKSDIPKMQKLLKLCVYLKLYLVLPYIAIYFDNSKHVDEESLSYHVSQNPQMIAYLDNNNAKYIFYYEAQDLLLQCFLSIVSLTLLSTICFTIFYSIQIIKVFIHSTPHDASSNKYKNRALSFKLFLIRAALSFFCQAIPILYFSFILFLSIKENDIELKVHKTIQVGVIIMHCYPTLLFSHLIIIYLCSKKIDIAASTQSLNRMQEVTVLENISHQI